MTNLSLRVALLVAPQTLGFQLPPLMSLATALSFLTNHTLNLWVRVVVFRARNHMVRPRIVLDAEDERESLAERAFQSSHAEFTSYLETLAFETFSEYSICDTYYFTCLHGSCYAPFRLHWKRRIRDFIVVYFSYLGLSQVPQRLASSCSKMVVSMFLSSIRG